MNELGKPIWLHPSRGAEHPDYLDEKKSLYEIWWTFGWPYETSVAMARLVFSKTLDKYPNLKIIAHHLGAMVPYHEGRVGPGWDQIGKRTTDEDYFALLKSLKKRPLDYFKQDFYADSAVFGSRAATICGLEFYGADRVVFASDCPFDPEGGPGYIRETIKILDGLDLSKADRDKIYFGNLERITAQVLGSCHPGACPGDPRRCTLRRIADTGSGDKPRDDMKETLMHPRERLAFSPIEKRASPAASQKASAWWCGRCCRWRTGTCRGRWRAW